MTSEMNQDPGAPAPASQVADAIDRLRQTAEEIEALVMAIENRMSCVTRDAASDRTSEVSASGWRPCWTSASSRPDLGPPSGLTGAHNSAS